MTNDPSPERWSRRVAAAQWIAVAALAVCVSVVFAHGASLPRVPIVEDPFPTFQEGSDWDRQWTMAVVGSVHIRAGEAAHWDPYTGAGSPLAANPESFVTHPAFRLAGADAVAGLRALIGWSVLLLILGSALLSHRLGGAPVLGAVCSLLVLHAPETVGRVSSGHLMFLGAFSWPAIAATTHGAIEAFEAGRTRDAARWLCASGVLIALSAVGGGHYAAVFALMLVALALWAAQSRPWALAGLLAVLGVCIAVTAAPLEAAWGTSLAGALFILAGVRGIRGWRVLGTAVLWLATGILAGGAGKLLTGLALSASSGRLQPFREVHGAAESLVLGELWSGGSAGLEGILAFPTRWVWPLLLLLLLSFWRLAPRLALACWAVFLFGLASGRPLQAWPLVELVPGMSAVGYPARLQWVALVLTPAAAAGLVGIAGRALPARAAEWAAVAVGSGALCWFFWPGASVGDPQQQQVESLSYEGAGEVTSVVEHSSQSQALSALQGSIQPGADLALRFQHPAEPSEGAGALAWSITPQPGGGTVQANILPWSLRLEGPAGQHVGVRQRDVSGWSCSQGAYSALPMADAVANVYGEVEGQARWLGVQLDESGSAECSWRAPGSTAAMVVRILALLLMLFGVTRRVKLASPG